MTRIEAWDASAARPGVVRVTPSTEQVLSLLGFEPMTIDELVPDGRTPLGDALATLARRLSILPERPILACGDVVEDASASKRVGDVSPAGEVDALASIAMSRGGAPQFMLVADAARPEDSMAERLRAALEPGLRSRVIGVLSLGEAADRTLALRERASTGRLVSLDRRDRARRALFDQALGASRVAMDWTLVSELAIGLLRDTDGTDPAHFELTLVRDIARRHSGLTAPIMWPEPGELGAYAPERQLTILAHVVQSVADGEWAAVPDYARRALTVVGTAGGEEALKLLGAVGRALAAVGDYEGARALLERALDAWLSTNPSEASYSLCELLRVDGILGHTDDVKRLRATADEILPTLNASSRAHVVLAVGRGLTQARCSKDALDVLTEEATGSHAPHHVQTSALRWRTVAARDVGEAEQASRAQALLEHLGESDQRELARLDTEQLDVRATRACLDALLAIPGSGDEARRLFSRLAPGLTTRAIAERPATLRRCRAEYRY